MTFYLGGKIMKDRISANLKEVMKKKNIDINSLSEKSNIPLETIKNIYYGKTAHPKIDTIYSICETLHISIDYLTGLNKYSKDDLKLLYFYSNASQHGRSYIMNIAKFEYLYTKFENQQEDIYDIPLLIPTGYFKDGMLYDTCIEKTIKTHLQKAYMAFKITMHDFAPVYCKNDIIYLSDRNPVSGEIAVFYKDNKVYFRQYIEENGKYILKALNNKGKDFVLDEMNEYAVLGTCIYIDRKSKKS